MDDVNEDGREHGDRGTGGQAAQDAIGNGSVELSRRRILRSLGLGAAAAVAGSALGSATTLTGLPGRHDLAAAGAAPLAGAAASPGPAAIGTTRDLWGPLITFRTPDGRYAAPIHACLLPQGNIMFMGGARASIAADPDVVFSRYSFTMMPGALGAAAPAEVTGTPWLEPMDITNQFVGGYVISDDLFCAGHALTNDGRLVTVGGTQSWKSLTKDKYDSTAYVFTGLAYATVFDGQGWRRVTHNMIGQTPNGQPRRWYPTVTRLPGGRLLVTSGNDEVYPVNRVNLSAEIFNPADETWSMASAFGQVPLEIWNHDYTHMVLLPKPIGGYQALSFGEMGIPVLHGVLSPIPWKVRRTNPRPGSEAFQAARIANGNQWSSDLAPNSGASTVPLPIRVNDGEWGYANGSVLIAGGAMDTAHAENIDVYDPVADAWHPSITTGIARHHTDTVCLPDGRILILGGEGMGVSALVAGYVDPAQNFAYSQGTGDSTELRAYHGVAILLPDGRVLFGGGRGADDAPWSEKPNFRYYYPNYMFSPRPVIASAPATIGINAAFSITTNGKAPAEIVLMGLGSFTHCFDQNQRHVQLRLSSVTTTGSSHVASVIGPPDRTTAPPGHYLLFALDGARIPSVAKIVRVLP